MSTTTLDTTTNLAEFPLTDGGCVVVGEENIGLSSPVHSFRAIRFHADGYATERGEWRDTAGQAITDGLKLAGWLTAVSTHVGRAR